MIFLYKCELCGKIFQAFKECIEHESDCCKVSLKKDQCYKDNKGDKLPEVCCLCKHYNKQDTSTGLICYCELLIEKAKNKKFDKPYDTQVSPAGHCCLFKWGNEGEKLGFNKVNLADLASEDLQF